MIFKKAQGLCPKGLVECLVKMKTQDKSVRVQNTSIACFEHSTDLSSRSCLQNSRVDLFKELLPARSRQ